MAGLARSRRGFPLLLLPRAGYWIEYIRALPRRAAPLREIPRRDAAPHKSCAALESLKKAWPDARARRLIRPAMNDRDYRRARASAVAAAKGKERSSLNCYSRPRRCDISSSLFCVRGRPRFGSEARLANKAPLLRAGVVTCLVVEARAAKISAIESGGCSGCAKAAGFGFS